MMIMVIIINKINMSYYENGDNNRNDSGKNNK